MEKLNNINVKKLNQEQLVKKEKKDQRIKSKIQELQGLKQMNEEDSNLSMAIDNRMKQKRKDVRAQSHNIRNGQNVE